MPDAPRLIGNLYRLPMSLEAVQRFLAHPPTSNDASGHVRQQALLQAAIEAGRAQLAQVEALLAEQERAYVREGCTPAAEVHQALDAVAAQLTALARACAEQLRSLQTALDELTGPSDGTAF